MTTQADIARDLLAAIRRTSGNEQLTFVGSPRPANAKGSVMFVELLGSTDHLDGTAVARVCPDLDVATREAAIHQFLNDRDFPTPCVLLKGSADDELGGAWLLTEHVPGVEGPVSGWRRRVNGLGSIGALWRRPVLLADLMARLHSVEAGPLRAVIGEGACDFDWYTYQSRLIDMLRTKGNDEVIDWVDTHRPVDSEDVVSHGDLHPSNIVVGPEGPMVIDWGIAGLAPAARDVACTMFALLNTGGRAPAPLRPLSGLLGRFSSGRFLRQYRGHSRAPMTPEELGWHRVLYSLNRILWAIVAVEANPTSAALEQEHPLHRRLINDITGIDIG